MIPKWKINELCIIWVNKLRKNAEKEKQPKCRKNNRNFSLLFLFVSELFFSCFPSTKNRQKATVACNVSNYSGASEQQREKNPSTDTQCTQTAEESSESRKSWYRMKTWNVRASARRQILKLNTNISRARAQQHQRRRNEINGSGHPGRACNMAQLPWPWANTI